MSEVSTELIQKSEAKDAFQAVLTVGRKFSDQIQEARDAQDEVAEAMLMSFGMTALQDAMIAHPQAWDVIDRSCGNKWGFRTDKDTFSKGYDKATVIAVYCEALLNKLRPVGNEFNIISSSLYVTKEGWRGKLERLPGVALVDCRAEVFADPEVREFQTKEYGDKPAQTKYKMTATIGATADCEVWGRYVAVEARQTDGRDERLQVSAMSEFADQVIDQLKGKVEARMYERLYEKVKSLSKMGPAVASTQVVKHIEMQKAGTQRIVANVTGDGLPQSNVATSETSDSLTDRERQLLAFKQTHDAMQRRVKDPKQLERINDAWHAIEIATDKETLRQMYQTISEWVKELGKNNVDELHRWCKFCADGLPDDQS